MKRLTESILQETATLPEGTPITAKMWLHLGSRAALDQALSRLVRRGKLLRAGRGVYVAPVASRFGSRAPSVQKVVKNCPCGEGKRLVLPGQAPQMPLG